MTSISPERASEVRRALAVIVADPGHGAAALDDPQILSNLLTDLLPDAPRDKNLLVAAAEARLARMIFDHVMQGLDAGSAIRLAAASFGASTHFPPETCAWAAGELAFALNLTGGLDGEPTASAPVANGDLPPRKSAASGTPGQELRQERQRQRPERRPSRARSSGTASDRGRGRLAAQPTRMPKADAVLVLVGTVALLAAFMLPVTSAYSETRILAFPFVIAGLPAIALVATAVSAVQLWTARGPRLWNAAAAAAAVLCGLELPVFFFVIWETQVHTGEANAGLGLVVGPLSALPLIAGGVIALRRQSRAARSGPIGHEAGGN